MGDFLLGIDIGTGACKTALIEPEKGQVFLGRRSYELHHPRPGWVEQNPEQWWLALQGAVTDIAGALNREDVVKVVSVCGTNALVPVDHFGQPVRNSIIFFDVRSRPQAEDLIKRSLTSQIFSLSGNRIAPGAFSLPSMLWMKEQESERYERTHQFLFPAGYIVHKLTGVFSMDYSRASFTLLFDVREHTWSEEICQAVGVEMDRLPPLKSSTDVVGTLSPDVDLPHVPVGTPVVAGCVDTVAASLASGSLLPGDTSAIFGTTGRICAVIGEPRFDSRFVNCCHALPNLWLVTAAMNGTGSSLQWFKKHLGQMELQAEGSAQRNAYQLLDSWAETSTPGAGGLLYLPYLSGERSPIWDPLAKGIFLGLSSSTTKSDLTRAILEGTVFSFRHNLEIMKSLNVRVERILATGGGSKSPLWMQILADVTGSPIDVFDIGDGETLGTALLGGMGIGMFQTPEKIVTRFVKKMDSFEPNPQNGEIYDRLYSLYLKSYDRLKDIFHELSGPL